MQELWNKIAPALASSGVNILIGAAVLAAGLFLSSKLVKLLLKNERLMRLDGNVRSFIKNFLGLALKVVVVIVAASMMGIPMTVFVALLSAASVAIGLALQGALSNLAGGVILLLTKPFSVGDYIETADGSGTVRDVNILYTVLTTPDLKVLTIPNGKLTAEPITNFSRSPKRRVDIEIGAAYGSDPDEVKRALLAAAAADERVLAEPAPEAHLVRHDDSALVFALRVFVESERYWDVKFALNEGIYRAFAERGISIPFPQLEVHTAD